eukprot:ANDGO_06095.mRNA.1 hypothetical protein
MVFQFFGSVVVRAASELLNKTLTRKLVESPTFQAAARGELNDRAVGFGRALSQEIKAELIRFKILQEVKPASKKP